MSLATAILPPPFTLDDRGVARIGRSRVLLEAVVHAFDEGASAEAIVESYPTLELSDVYATVAYILRNRPEIDAYMAESAAASEQAGREWDARFPTDELRRRVRERAARR